MSKGVSVDRRPDTTWLTADEAATHADRARRFHSHARGRRPARITERTVRSWVHRGHLTVGNYDDRGRQLFALPDVIAAERATRDHALRLAGTA